ncbi:hypothetical protein DXA74_14490, partial [Bacteroides sp. OF04-15BH]
ILIFRRFFNSANRLNKQRYIRNIHAVSFPEGRFRRNGKKATALKNNQNNSLNNKKDTPPSRSIRIQKRAAQKT